MPVFVTALPPVHTPLGERLRERTEQLQSKEVDKQFGYAHGYLAEAMMRPFEQIATVVDPPDPYVPWEPIFNVDICPDWALPWLAQCVGVKLPASVTPAQARELIKGLGFMKRGTTAAIEAAGAPLLKPGVVHNVYFRERDGGDAYRLEIVVNEESLPESDLPLYNAVTNPRPASVTGWRGYSVTGSETLDLTNVVDPTSKTGLANMLAGAVDAQRWVRLFPDATDLDVVADDHVAVVISGRGTLGATQVMPVVIWHNSLGEILGQTNGAVVPVTGAWQEFKVNVKVPTGVGIVGAAPAIEFNCALGEIELFAAAALIANVSPGRIPNYGDGSLPGWVWEAAPDASASAWSQLHTVQDAYGTQVPAGIVFAFRSIFGWDYEQMTIQGGTYGEQSVDYLTYRKLAENEKG
jgi:hypothetical protein